MQWKIVEGRQASLSGVDLTVELREGPDQEVFTTTTVSVPINATNNEVAGICDALCRNIMSERLAKADATTKSSSLINQLIGMSNDVAAA